MSIKVQKLVDDVSPFSGISFRNEIFVTIQPVCSAKHQYDTIQWI